MKLPSIVGEASTVVSVLNYIMWAQKILPDWTKWLLIPFGLLVVYDWMEGGISDKGVCKKCLELIRKRKNNLE